MLPSFYFYLFVNFTIFVARVVIKYVWSHMRHEEANDFQRHRCVIVLMIGYLKITSIHLVWLARNSQYLWVFKYLVLRSMRSQLFKYVIGIRIPQLLLSFLNDLITSYSLHSQEPMENASYHWWSAARGSRSRWVATPSPRSMTRVWPTGGGVSLSSRNLTRTSNCSSKIIIVTTAYSSSSEL